MKNVKVRTLLVLVSCFFFFDLTLTTVAASEQPQLRIITLNIHAASRGGTCKEPGSDDTDNGVKDIIRANLDQLPGYFKSMDPVPDIILLQEVAFNCGFKDMDDQLALRFQEEGLWEQVYHSSTREADKYWHGVATYSRFPIDQANVEWIDATRDMDELASLSDEYLSDPDNRKPSRVFLLTPIETPLGNIDVLNLHTVARDPRRCIGINTAFNYIRNKETNEPIPGKTIIGGDFNVTLAQPDWYFCTFPNLYSPPDPLDKIWSFVQDNVHISTQELTVDHILFTDQSGFKFVSGYMDPETPVSDHDAIITDIALAFTPSCTLSSGPEVSCSDDGTQATITWELVDANFEYQSITNRVNVIEDPPVWSPTIDSDDPTIDRFINAPIDDGEMTFSVIPNQEYGYRLDVYQPEKHTGPFGVCSMNDPLTGGKTRRERYEANPTDVDTDTDIYFSCSSSTVSPDYNENGVVDIQDYSVLIQHFGQDTQQTCQYNLAGTENCLIDIFDFGVMVQEFGT